MKFLPPWSKSDGAGLMVQVLMRGDLVEGSPNRRSRYGKSALHLSQWPQRLGEAFDAAQSASGRPR
jgi:hypothetical protein